MKEKEAILIHLLLFPALFISLLQGGCVRHWPTNNNSRSLDGLSSFPTSPPIRSASATPFRPIQATSTTVVQGQIFSSQKNFLPLVSNADPAIEQQVENTISEPVFSLMNSNTIRPEDVLEEVAFGGGGGGGGPCPNVNEPPNPPFHQVLSLASSIYWIVCGWSDGEVAQASVERPDGRTDHLTYKEGENILYPGNGYKGLVIVYYPTRLTDPVGWYHLKLSGLSGSLEALFYFMPPKGPRLYTLATDRLLFYGFEPNESVRLFAYRQIERYKNKFVAWQEYQVGSDGQLEVQLEVEAKSFVAIGLHSGEVHLWPNGVPYNNFQYYYLASIQGTDCFHEERTKFSLGDFVRPEYKHPLSNGVYELYTDLNSYKRSGKVIEGDRLTVLEEPVCKSQTYYWYLQTDGGLRGWLPGYFLEAYPDIDTLCFATPLPRLSPGKQGRVTVTEDGRPLIVRNEPGLEALKINLLSEGSFFFTLEGPVCLDGYYWWHIQMENNLEGWVAEGDNNYYFVEPMPNYFLSESKIGS